MSPEIIAREQKKDTHLKEVMKKSDKLSERIVERSTVITYIYPYHSERGYYGGIIHTSNTQV
jgi:hypothetical protein